jgi:phosphotransferase system HPr-like phosphotransfer protein
MSKQVEIKLGAIDDVKDFVNIVSKYDFDVDLRSDRHSIDAKSILGIFSLDLSKPVKVEIQSDDCLDFIAELNRFAVK